AHEPVRRYINTLVGGAAGRWPLDWFQEAFSGLRFARALSVGCGTGALERDLLQRGLCDAIDAFDGSIGSLAAARSLEPRVRYYASDFNRPALPRNHYDAVFCHQSLHHVAKLEKLFRAILLALKPEGYLYIDEYVGPSRSEWTPRLIAAADEVYRTVVPPEARNEHLAAPIVPEDPSEAVRSSEIVAQLGRGFDVVAMRPYGGDLLAIVCPQIDWTQAQPDLIDALIARERDAFPKSHHAIIVARPKKGTRARVASARYFFEPKVKRVLRALTSAP
ncbi:MAG TPA: class I SAM-dependent methyltransferase, partial [Thermoanaerobaculia bacterium]|nr:class I SAM-dependent methyltransferase [Thermoanaerobaculia bacterium]